MFFKVAPQFLCIATNDENTISAYHLEVPFSGCLSHVDNLYWKGVWYKFLSVKRKTIVNTVVNSYFTHY